MDLEAQVTSNISEAEGGYGSMKEPFAEIWAGMGGP